MDYFAHPYSQTPSLFTWPFFVDFESRHAIVLDDGNQPLVLTAAADISNVFALALDDDRRWPVEGGMQGDRTTIIELIALGKRLRGGDWTIEHVKSEDIENWELKTKWVPQMTHPVIPLAEREKFSKEFVCMFFMGVQRGAWDVGGEWNKRFPEYNFTGLEEYMRRAWEGKD